MDVSQIKVQISTNQRWCLITPGTVSAAAAPNDDEMVMSTDGDVTVVTDDVVL